MTTSISDQRVGEFADAVASDAATPGGGAVAGTVAAFGAALVTMAARFSLKKDPGSVGFTGIVERAEQIRVRVGALADADAAAYRGYLDAVRSQADPQTRRATIRAAQDAAADVPFELGGLAAEIAEAGEELAVSGDPRLRSDACAAALFASAVAGTAALLVQDNLHQRPQDPRLVRAT